MYDPIELSPESYFRINSNAGGKKYLVPQAIFSQVLKKLYNIKPNQFSFCTDRSEKSGGASSGIPTPTSTSPSNEPSSIPGGNAPPPVVRVTLASLDECNVLLQNGLDFYGATFFPTEPATSSLVRAGPRKIGASNR